jgi:hypothetical protein
MKVIISDKFIEESLADKTRWFASLTMEQRLAWLEEWTAIILQNNPTVLEKFNHDSTFKGTICVLRKIRG